MSKKLKPPFTKPSLVLNTNWKIPTSQTNKKPPNKHNKHTLYDHHTRQFISRSINACAGTYKNHLMFLKQGLYKPAIVSTLQKIIYWIAQWKLCSNTPFATLTASVGFVNSMSSVSSLEFTDVMQTFLILFPLWTQENTYPWAPLQNQFPIITNISGSSATMNIYQI